MALDIRSPCQEIQCTTAHTMAQSSNYGGDPTQTPPPFPGTTSGGDLAALAQEDRTSPVQPRARHGLATDQDVEDDAKRADTAPPKAMQCEGGCKRMFKRGCLFPTIDGMGWQGSVGLHCLDCYAEKWRTVKVGNKLENIEGMTQSRFSKCSKKKWELRLEVAKNYDRMNKDHMLARGTQGY